MPLWLPSLQEQGVLSPMKDQALSCWSTARREENSAINLTVSRGRELPGSEEAARALNSPQQPHPCQRIPDTRLPNLSGRGHQPQAAPGCPSTASQALSNALGISWAPLRAVFSPGLDEFNSTDPVDLTGYSRTPVSARCELGALSSSLGIVFLFLFIKHNAFFL